MRVISWNVNSITARLPLVTAWLTEHQPEVVCLQETKTPDEKFPRTVFEELGYQVAILGQKSYNGVAILSKFPLTDMRLGWLYDQTLGHCRLLGATIQGVQVLNLYIPNGGTVDSDKFQYKLGWLEQLNCLLKESYDPQAPVLLCGDFNISPAELDVYDVKAMTNQVGFHPLERAALEQIRAWGLVDTFRLHQPEQRQFSWWDYREGAFRRNKGLRIDHIWVTPSLASKCIRSWIDPEPRKLEKPSDHAPVGAEFIV